MITNLNVFDNFYSDPNAVRILLNGDYPITGCGAGKRSIGLENIDLNLYKNFCDSIFNIHGISSKGLYVTTYFMEHSYNEIDIFNHGWMHIDGKTSNACRTAVTDEYKLVLGGQIFLTPNSDPETGVKVGVLKPDTNWNREELINRAINDYTLPREDYEAGKINLQEYEILHKDYHNNFDITCDVKNVYNRMVSWKGGSLHASKITNLMPKRLNQHFFVEII